MVATDRVIGLLRCRWHHDMTPGVPTLSQGLRHHQQLLQVDFQQQKIVHYLLRQWTRLSTLSQNMHEVMEEVGYCTY